ncbi:Tumor necrosis factor alpha-induced protein 8-like protein 1 [Characodon lateralis]|uniref:Tumor necrosis factor alpha-induced protein 8-like protein 1 n=1 Tax=Characodon lateralis TaxID=208331 RepID=A0ABU7D6U8_9TELE|nr:Tumor necrosis factor alpha-induced protein 8-like protein 1 [Characodon lateralis]
MVSFFVARLGLSAPPPLVQSNINPLDYLVNSLHLTEDLTMDSFSTKSLALQAQKKLMSKMATKSMANLFIDDTSSEVLDELYRVTKEYTRNRKESQKIIKNLIKMVVKLGVLYRNNQFNSEELILVENFRKKVHTLAMTAVSFHQIEFTFDRRIMSGILNECRELLHQAIRRHLTAKSHSRVNHVFNHFADCDFLAALYGPSEVYRAHRLLLDFLFLFYYCKGLLKLELLLQQLSQRKHH